MAAKSISRSCRVSPTSIRSRILKDTHHEGIEQEVNVSPTSIRSRILKVPYWGHQRAELQLVSPTSIRSRILKGQVQVRVLPEAQLVSPTSIRSRILKVMARSCSPSSAYRFTHVDPFEDTERLTASIIAVEYVYVSPTSIRSRILKGPLRQ